MASNYWRAKMILADKEKLWLKVNPSLPKTSGIYILTRIDENGIKYGYVGQAKNILGRLASHLYQYPPQHIDLSLKKHKLYDKDKNPYGWNVQFVETSDLDNAERYYIKLYADQGYQLRNKTLGGQDQGKDGLEDNRPAKGYHDGIAQGYKNCKKEVRGFFKYLKFLPNQFKNNSLPTELALRKEKEFAEFLAEEKEDERDN